MQIEIKIDPSCTEPKIIVVAESMSEEVQNLVKRLSVDVPQVISGIRDERLDAWRFGAAVGHCNRICNYDSGISGMGAGLLFSLCARTDSGYGK